jgi:hypothetical protein
VGKTGEEGDRPCRLRGRPRRRARRTTTPPASAASPCTPGSSPSRRRRQRARVGIGRGQCRRTEWRDPFRSGLWPRVRVMDGDKESHTGGKEIIFFPRWTPPMLRSDGPLCTENDARLVQLH